MTPKEKAIEIYKEHLEWISKSYYHDGTYSQSEEDKSKECAKITVNEVIKACEFNNVESYNSDWWNKVIEEIDKL